MWFLWLVGAVIEDIWGRLFFISFYIFCGCFAAISHNLFHANSSEPLVGASGAIAGTMGAFLIKYYKTRINFFYLLIIFIMPKYGTFSLPASIMLILWFLQQIFFALIDPNGLLGIGFIAHIGGFACGAIIAIILIKSGIEKKYLLSRTEAITTLTQKQEIIDAIEAMKNNNFSDAEKYLLKLINKEPDNIDALLLLLEISKKKLDDGASQNYLAALIESYVKKDECKSAADLYNENIFSFPDLKITLQATLKLANYFKNIGRFQDALDLLYKTYKSNENAFAGIKALMTYADLCLSIEKYEDAKNAYLKILQKEIAPELHDHIKIKLAKLNAHSSFYNRLNKKGS
jgi:tetratricopeptide (TPR) repeat protein